LQAGFSEHLIKPIKLEKLEAAIERAIGLTWKVATSHYHHGSARWHEALPSTTAGFVGTDTRL